MKKMTWLVLGGLLLGLGCGRESVHRIDPSSDMSRLVVRNMSDGYEWTLWVNGEPVRHGYGVGISELRGFPLVPGSNEVIFAVERMGEIGPEVRVTASSAIGRRLFEEGLFKLVAQQDGRTVMRADVRMPDGDSAEIAFDQIPRNEGDELRRTLGPLAIRISQALSRLDFPALSSITGPEDVSADGGYYPAWMREEGALKDCNVEVVGNLDDVDIVTGKRVVLVRPSIRFANSSKHRALVAIDHVTLRTSFSLSAIAFIRQAGAWAILDINGAPLFLEI